MLLYGILFIAFVVFVTAMFCYIHELEKRVEIAEAKISCFPQNFCVDEASLFLNNISRK